MRFPVIFALLLFASSLYAQSQPEYFVPVYDSRLDRTVRSGQLYEVRASKQSKAKGIDKIGLMPSIVHPGRRIIDVAQIRYIFDFKVSSKLCPGDCVSTVKEITLSVGDEKISVPADWYGPKGERVRVSLSQEQLDLFVMGDALVELKIGTFTGEFTVNQQVDLLQMCLTALAASPGPSNTRVYIDHLDR